MKRSDESAQTIWPEVGAFAALWAVWFAWFYRLWPIWDDHAVFHLMAANWLGGGRPYIEAIDPNWPGAMLLHAVAFALGGYAPWGVRLVDAVLQVWLAGTTCYVLAAWRVERPWRVVAVALYTITYYNGTFGTMAQREGLALPFLMCGLLPWLLPVEKSRALSWARLIFLHGICLGMAVCIKPPLGLGMLIVGAGSLICSGVAWRQWLRWVLAGAAGGFLWLGLVAFLLWRAGSLEAFRYWGVTFAFSDYVADVVPWWKRAVHLSKWMSGVGALTTLGLVMGLFLWRRQRGRVQSPLLWVVAWLVAGFLAGALVQGKTYCLYHFLPFFYALAFAVAALLGMSELPLSVGQRRGIYAGVAALLLAHGIGYSLQSRAPTSGYALGLQLREVLKPGENVAIIGFAPTLYLATGKQPPYPIVNSMLFYVLNEAAQEREEDRLISILSDPKIRFFMIDSIFFDSKRPFTRVDRRSRLAPYLREHFQPPKVREVRGNPLEFAEPVQYLIFERQ